jgi:cytochrome c biogenesis protein CcmG/thiol:disulfide interchange protein DsbE
MKKIFLVISISMLFFSTIFAGNEPKIGETGLPSINLTDLKGKTYNSLDITKDNKITVISFWATWCVPCKKELNTINEVYEEWQKKYDMKLVAISIDDSRSATKVKPYIDGQRWEFDVLLDINQDFKRALNIQSVPFTILLDQNGKIVYSHSGYVEGDESVLEEEIIKLTKK